MNIRSLSAQDFRNIALARMDFSGPRQFFYGANGQGKTNLLEALGMISALRSFRTAEVRPLIRQGQREALLFMEVKQEKTGEREIDLHLRLNGRKLIVDGEPGYLRDVLGVFPTVVLCSDDAQLPRGSPAVRRRWMDLVLSSVDAAYFRALRDYHRALGERNALLKKDRPDARQLGVYERLMATHAAELVRRRANGVAALAVILREKYAILSGDEDEEPDIQLETKIQEPKAEALVRLWHGNRTRDRAARATTMGPHRDDLGFRLKGGEAQVMGSEGQQRGLVVSLRLAQAAFYHRELGIAPVLLADDVLGEFDPVRRERFWQALGKETAQVVATGTQLPADADRWQVFDIRRGKVRESAARS